MRITKEIAENAARKLLAKKREQNAAKEKQFNAALSEQYRSTVPIDVLIVFETYPSYISTSRYLHLYDNGNYIAQIVVSDDLPKKDGNLNLQLISADVKRFRNIKAEEKRIDELQETISNALYDLRTMKNVEKHFPEAVQYIPSAQTTALAINLEPLRALINS